MNHETSECRVPRTDGPPPDDRRIAWRYLPDATEQEVYAQAWWAYCLTPEEEIEASGYLNNVPYATGTLQRGWWDEAWESCQAGDAG